MAPWRGVRSSGCAALCAVSPQDRSRRRRERTPRLLPKRNSSNDRRRGILSSLERPTRPTRQARPRRSARPLRRNWTQTATMTRRSLIRAPARRSRRATFSASAAHQRRCNASAISLRSGTHCMPRTRRARSASTGPASLATALRASLLEAMRQRALFRFRSTGTASASRPGAAAPGKGFCACTPSRAVCSWPMPILPTTASAFRSPAPRASCSSPMLRDDLPERACRVTCRPRHPMRRVSRERRCCRARTTCST